MRWFCPRPLVRPTRSSTCHASALRNPLCPSRSRLQSTALPPSAAIPRPHHQPFPPSPDTTHLVLYSESHSSDTHRNSLPASAHRDSHCQAVHRTWARSIGDVAHAGAAHQRNISDNIETQQIWEQPASPHDPAQAFAVSGHENGVLPTCAAPTDTCRRIGPERSGPNGQSAPWTTAIPVSWPNAIEWPSQLGLGHGNWDPTRALSHHSARPTHDSQPPDSQFHVVYDITTTLKLRRRHFV
jgi:hypothetical protein